MQVTAEQLRPIFEPFGNIEDTTIIYDKATHLSKGVCRTHSRRALALPLWG
jgi:RNA recognition motif-containing protein